MQFINRKYLNNVKLKYINSLCMKDILCEIIYPGDLHSLTVFYLKIEFYIPINNYTYVSPTASRKLIRPDIKTMSDFVRDPLFSEMVLEAEELLRKSFVREMFNMLELFKPDSYENIVELYNINKVHLL